MLDERRLAGMIAGEHRPDLRHRDVRFVDEAEEIVGEEIEQRRRRFARLARGERPAVVLDARAETGFAEQFDVVSRAGREALGFDELPLLAEDFESFDQFFFDLADGRVDPFLRQYEVLRRIDVRVLQLAGFLPGQRVDDRQFFNLIPPQFNAIGELFVGGPDTRRRRPARAPYRVGN